ncbi:ATP-binding protein [Streptomyces microflavus]|uniref:ATP-binding protein n=1 Tax=Streptomyces microflavus TaxID=1919 RepID=UPI0036B0786C
MSIGLPTGARLARRLATHRLHVWGHRYGSETNDAVALVVAELAANSVTHGAVCGRGALLRLSRERDGLIRVEVSHTRGERLPAPAAPDATAVAGRGRMIVAALAEDWRCGPARARPARLYGPVSALPEPWLMRSVAPIRAPPPG